MMSVKNMVASVFAAAAFGTFAMAQGGQPAQPGQPQPGQPPREGFGRGGGDRREFGVRRMARPGMMRQRRGGGGPGRIDFNRLNLTDAQKQRIQTLLENNRRTSETNRAQFEEMARLMGLKRQGLLTTEQGTRLTALQAQMTTNAERMQSDLMAILTPEQRTLVEQMRNSPRGGARGMRGMRGPRTPFMRRTPGAPNRPDRPNRPNPPQPPPPAPNN